MATVIVASPYEEDHHTVGRMLADQHWRVEWARTRDEVVEAMRRGQVAVVIAERDLSEGSWKDVLGQLQPAANPPLLIVASRYADNYLWAEVLNLGGWDVINKPFHEVEVSRVVQLAGERWQKRAVMV